MMADREVTQKEVDQLIEDASYLQDEADALQYVITDVPYDERPPGGKSIAEMLLLIDHAQLSYYRPIMEDAVDDPRPTHLDDYIHFEESFDVDEEKIKNIEKLLRKLSKHRAGVVNAIKNIPLIDWETSVYKDNQQLLLLDFMQEMITFERNTLKDIAEQVKIYNQEKENRREIEKRRKQRHGEPPSQEG